MKERYLSKSHTHRVLNDFRGPDSLAVVWFGSNPPSTHTFSSSKLSIFLSLTACRRSSLPDRRGGGMGEEPNHTTARSLVLYKSVCTLWPPMKPNLRVTSCDSLLSSKTFPWMPANPQSILWHSFFIDCFIGHILSAFLDERQYKITHKWHSIISFTFPADLYWYR